VTVDIDYPAPSAADDWVGVFSPANLK